MNESGNYDLSQLKQLEKIGEGGYGVVYKVKEKKTGKIYAAKVFKILNSQNELQINREIKISSQIKHPSIIKFIGYSNTDFAGYDIPVIITEYMRNGSLSEIIQKDTKNKYLTDTKKLIILYGIASAMNFLHSHSIVHRDLKPGNILMDKNFYPKLTDFGLSKSIDQMQKSAKIFKGTILYSSPEFIINGDFTYKSDVYSFGIMAFEIMTGKVPFLNIKSNFDLMNRIIDGERPKFTFVVPKGYKTLIERCWSNDQSLRPSFEEIVNDLDTNPSFITEFVDVDDYLNYIKYIEEYNSMFISSSEQIPSPFEFNQSQKSLNVSIDLNEQADLITSQHSERSRTDPIKLANYYKDAADNENNKTAMFRYAVFLFTGNGVEVNEELSAQYFKKSADRGEISAMYNYAVFCEKGIGVKIDMNESAKYYEMASNFDHPNSMHNLSILLLNGNGISKNEEKAAYYMKRAAEKGLKDAMYNYGMMLFEGRGIKMNKKESAHYLEMAADAGHLDALHNYMKMLYNGDGIDKDVKKAHYYAKILKKIKINH